MTEPQPDGAVHRAVADHVLRVVIDRPAKRNALTQAMYAGLADALEHAEADPDVRVVLVRGAGDVFTAGNDLDDFGGPGDGPLPVTRFLAALVTSTVPIVAAVRGVAVGVGTTMLLHCDLVYAAEGTRFRLPFVDLGLVPEAASSLLLPQLVGHRRAAELLYTSRFFPAEEAAELGIVNTVVPDADLDAAAEEAATTLATKAPGALRRTKELLRTPTSALVERMALEQGHFVEQLRSPEFAEASAAFFEKRTPRF